MPQPPLQQAPPLQAPMQIAPPAAIEIKSQPVAGVDAAVALQPTADAQTADKSHDSNPFSAFSKFLRTDTSPVPPDQAPRPPMPVGQ